MRSLFVILSDDFKSSSDRTTAISAAEVMEAAEDETHSDGGHTSSIHATGSNTTRLGSKRAASSPATARRDKNSRH